jgi:hypothetical protein
VAGTEQKGRGSPAGRGVVARLRAADAVDPDDHRREPGDGIDRLPPAIPPGHRRSRVVQRRTPPGDRSDAPPRSRRVSNPIPLGTARATRLIYD